MKRNIYLLLRNKVNIALFVLIIFNSAMADESVAIETVRTFMTNILGTEVTSIIEHSGVEFLSYGLPYKNIEANQRYSFKVSENGTTIYGYSFMDPVDSESIRGKTNADAISENAAFSVVIPVLSYLGLPIEKSLYTTTFDDSISENENTRGDLYGSCWFILKKYELNGIPCRTRHICITVSAASGVVTGFANRVIIPPENAITPQVSYETACQTALTWFQTKPYFPPLTPEITEGSPAQVVIAPKYNPFEGPPETLLKTYYSWEVPLSWIERRPLSDLPVKGCIWVDIESGAVVGFDAK